MPSLQSRVWASEVTPKQVLLNYWYKHCLDTREPARRISGRSHGWGGCSRSCTYRELQLSQAQNAPSQRLGRGPHGRGRMRISWKSGGNCSQAGRRAAARTQAACSERSQHIRTSSEGGGWTQGCATGGQYLSSLGAVGLSARRRPGHSQDTSWARFLPEHTDWNAACDCLTAESIPRSLPPNLLFLFSQGNWKQSRPRKGPK